MKYYFYSMSTTKGSTIVTGVVCGPNFSSIYKKIEDDNKGQIICINSIIPIAEEDFISLSDRFNPGWNK